MSAEDGEILPVEFEPTRWPDPGRGRARRRPLHPGRIGLGLAAALLAVLVWFSLTAVSVEIVTEPALDALSFPGTLLRVSFGDRTLLRPGTHRIFGEAEGYLPLEESLSVGSEPDQRFAFELVKRPGLLRVGSTPVEGAEVRVDGVAVGRTPLDGVALRPGLHHIELEAPRHLVHREELEIEGGGLEQWLEVDLVPAWALVTLSSSPAGARVFVDGEELGETPGSFELEAGTRALELRRAGYAPHRAALVVEADRPQTHPEIALREADGRLRLVSEPPGAEVAVGDARPGQTPLSVALAPRESHEIILRKAGYARAERLVSLAPEEEKTLRVRLEPQFGVVQLVAQPADAQLEVDGEPAGSANQELRLLAVSHELRVTRPGYGPQLLRVTPKPGQPQRIEVSLLTEAEAKRAAMPRRIETSRGQKLALVPPGRFTMGTPRGTRGRRANETPRTVELTRPYYLGVREISNREYREFRSSHHAEAFAGKRLDGDDQPVSGIPWDDAARFCNWLSRVDGLPPAYVERAEGLVAAEPMTTGYRLPTEAEWAWAARFDGGAGGTAARLYPWGDAESPPKGAGNYADQAASGILPHTMAGYADGFAVAAPVGSGRRNAVGIRDLGGNVAEWVHDLYTIYPPSPSGSVWQNPVGPSQGQSHVIRGASWKEGRLARLRLAYRDYSAQARADVGFRIARSAE